MLYQQAQFDTIIRFLSLTRTAFLLNVPLSPPSVFSLVNILCTCLYFLYICIHLGILPCSPLESLQRPFVPEWDVLWYRYTQDRLIVCQRILSAKKVLSCTVSHPPNNVVRPADSPVGIINRNCGSHLVPIWTRRCHYIFHILKRWAGTSSCSKRWWKLNTSDNLPFGLLSHILR